MRLKRAQQVQIAYRATRADGVEVETRFVGDAARATAAAAYARLCARFGPIDPATVEIETRPAAEILPFRTGAAALMRRLRAFPPDGGAPA
jgi:hypothetical protein